MHLEICELMARLRKDMAVVEVDCQETRRLIIESRRALAAFSRVSRVEADCQKTRRLVIESRRRLQETKQRGLAALESPRSIAERPAPASGQ